MEEDKIWQKIKTYATTYNPKEFEERIYKNGKKKVLYTRSR